MLTESLRARLGELARVRHVANGPASDDASADAVVRGAGERPASIAGAIAALGAIGTLDAGRGAADTIERRPSGVEAFLPGGEWRDAHGGVFVHERLRSELERPRHLWGFLPPPPNAEPDLLALEAVGMANALFLDLETGGFASSPVFLAGTMHWNGSDFVLRQYFARHYGEEATLLRAVDQQIRAFQVLVTFNGKTYDVPFLRHRALVHGIELRLPAGHLDLLHPARRRWKTRLEDCRLQTLERHVCRRRRWGDVPSDEVPALYHDYVRRGDPYRLIPVFHHNLLDVITMEEILRALCVPPAAGGG
jgi:uncharacterized protein YprB with RNaseH-like and TPR domain